MSGTGSTQQSLRKALGTLKDSTKVGLAKVNSEYKDVDVAIVKATNHDEKIPKEKHIRTIFDAVSASRPRADIQYCISSLARRLGKTHNWAVALKILIVIHRTLREADPTFRGELINYTSNRGHLLNLSHFKDDSSPNAWDYSAWVRTYALFLEERLECFRVLKYDVETEQCQRMKELGTVDLLEHLPAFQQLLFRLLGCQPEGAAMSNDMIQYALSFVASESIRIYTAIDSGILNLVNKFFDMQRHDAVRAIEIYRKSGQQAERLSEFYEMCKGLNLWKSEKFIRIKQPPQSFAAAMEEYVKEAPRALPFPRSEPTRALLKVEDDHRRLELASVPSEPYRRAPDEAPGDPPVTDLLGLDDISCWNAAKLDEKNSSALDILTDENPSSSGTSTLELDKEDPVWELTLVSMHGPTGSLAVESRLGGGLDELTLNSLYDDATARKVSPIESSFPRGMAAADGQTAAAAAATGVDCANNPFGNPYGSMDLPPCQPPSPYARYL
ncbi:unnamed protein product [Spirodela intermedia]|uniref:ENTH domain-containing protein n=1 Tax=Spirodela intermedia TaxID=51605 RepID=A0A7I8LDD5_SPIIN|nr:unnamed protein product [Spirodela intermedia]